MNIFLLCLFIFLLILLVIILPLKIKAGLHINYLKMEAYYLVNFLFINFICGKIKINNEGVTIENKSNHFTGGGKSDDYSRYLIEEYIRRIKIVNINFYKSYGSDDDAMNTAIICAIDNMIFNCINKIIRSKNSMLNSYNYIDPNFCNAENMTSIYGVIKISILDVIISTISAKLRISKIKRKEKSNG